MINKKSHLPIYYQLEEEIKKLIEEKQLQPGDLIPSEREFSETHEISRMTVRQAINNLTSEGILEKQRGKGTFVAQAKLEQSLQGLTSFSEEMAARGMEPSSRMLSFQRVKATNHVANRLEVEEGTEIYEIKRIRLADSIPMAYETSYMPVTLLPRLTEEVASHSLYGYVENEQKQSIKKATQSIEASSATKEEATILEIEEKSSVLLFHRTGYLENQKPFEVVKSIYRADRYKFFIQLER
ncbi:GntR family transcriptional regulator [Alkalicoccobacillus porphyridii]|uniref:GntR family transcriptional regulator n=1 Tax=Alkalicoccobacillus porphyridii TaxID=2597270 RepID=A0A554A0Y5_9BACI|nr:GntR family transcriptional regulator [Alkalicoccobacillus porphyridii]TSB47345.1 GntR family transcriptional regulator [Alkalicoccobacillus porphyridii]